MSNDGRRLHADQAGPESTGLGLSERTEVHSPGFLDAFFVRTAKIADDPSRETADKRRCGPLQIEQFLLHIQPVKVSAQASIGFDHPMARNDDWDGIGGHGVADGARGFAAPELLGNGLVGTDFPVWNRGRNLESGKVEAGQPGKIDGNAEIASLAGEVLRQFPPSLPDERRTPRIGILNSGTVPVQCEPADTSCGCREVKSEPTSIEAFGAERNRYLCLHTAPHT